MSHSQSSHLHHQAEELREQGDFLSALGLYEEVVLAYQDEANYRGIADALQGRFLTYKHLYWNTKDKTFAHIAMAQVQASLQISLEHELPLAFVYFSLGEVHMLHDDYPSAIGAYERCINEYGSGPHIGDMHYHLGEAYYRAGQKEKALSLIYQGLEEIQKYAYTLDEFVAHVWESGCHMRLADLLRNDDPPKSSKHLAAAKLIIDADHRLILRKQQLTKLTAALQEIT